MTTSLCASTQPEERDLLDLAAIDADDGALERLAIERKGNKLDVAPIDIWRTATSFTEPGVIDPDNRFVRTRPGQARVCPSD